MLFFILDLPLLVFYYYYIFVEFESSLSKPEDFKCNFIKIYLSSVCSLIILFCSFIFYVYVNIFFSTFLKLLRMRPGSAFENPFCSSGLSSRVFIKFLYLIFFLSYLVYKILSFKSLWFYYACYYFHSYSMAKKVLFSRLLLFGPSSCISIFTILRSSFISGSSNRLGMYLNALFFFSEVEC